MCYAIFIHIRRLFLSQQSNSPASKYRPHHHWIYVLRMNEILKYKKLKRMTRYSAIQLIRLENFIGKFIMTQIIDIFCIYMFVDNRWTNTRAVGEGKQASIACDRRTAQHITTPRAKNWMLKIENKVPLLSSVRQCDKSAECCCGGVGLNDLRWQWVGTKLTVAAAKNGSTKLLPVYLWHSLSFTQFPFMNFYSFRSKFRYRKICYATMRKKIRSTKPSVRIISCLNYDLVLKMKLWIKLNIKDKVVI